jgi:hypothetical protein
MRGTARTERSVVVAAVVVVVVRGKLLERRGRFNGGRKASEETEMAGITSDRETSSKD